MEAADVASCLGCEYDSADTRGLLRLPLQQRLPHHATANSSIAKSNGTRCYGASAVGFLYIMPVCFERGGGNIFVKFFRKQPILFELTSTNLLMETLQSSHGGRPPGDTEIFPPWAASHLRNYVLVIQYCKLLSHCLG